MKNIIAAFCCSLFSILSYGQFSGIKAFSLDEVKIKEGPFYDAQQSDLKYILELDVDRLLAPFMVESGIKPKAEIYGNWEGDGMGGHIGGHYLSALSLMYVSTNNKELYNRLIYMINELDRCQQQNGNGYIGGIPGGKELWKEIAKGDIEAGAFSLNKKWVPWYNLHKLFAGLRDAYQIAGIERAKDMLIKLSDWCNETLKNLTDEQVQEMMKCEHGGMNEVLADVYEITGDEKYLTLAEKFSDKKILNPLLQQEDKLTGLHANTQIPKVIGYEKIAELSDNEDWHKAADFFWHTVVENRTISIGGNSVREHFNPVDDFSTMIESSQGPETCNSYNMLKLSKELFLFKPDVKYMDYYEEALFNHILSSQHPGGGFVYFTSIRPRHYRVYSQPQQCFWCCVGSGLENHGKYGEMIYAHDDNNIFVNLFLNSELNWKEKGVNIIQDTKFPFENKILLKMTLVKPQNFNLKIRVPEWTSKNEFKVLVNNKEVNVSSEITSYLTINRKWKSGDEVSVEFPMHIHLKYLPDSSSWASVMYGPIVFAAATDTTDLDGLFADGSRMGHDAIGKKYPIEEAPMLMIDKVDDMASIKMTDSSTLTFTADDIIFPDKYNNLELKPFFNLHDARYMIYWRITDHESVDKIKEEIRMKDSVLLALEKITVDQVATGEQQPESDHGFKGENTESGSFSERFWRHAIDGWFSYNLKDPEKEGKYLRITYTGVDSGRTFDILINDILLATVTSTGSKQLFFDVDYPLTPEIIASAKDNIYTVKFRAHKGSTAGGIYYVRLIKK